MWEYAGYANHPLAYNAVACAMRQQVGEYVQPSPTTNALILSGFAVGQGQAVRVVPDLTAYSKDAGTHGDAWIGQFTEWLVGNRKGMAVPPSEREARAAWAAALVEAANDGNALKVGGLFSLTGVWVRNTEQPRDELGRWTSTGSRAKGQVWSTFGVYGTVSFKADDSGKLYGEHGSEAVVVNPHLGGGKPKGLNFKAADDVTETHHLVAHELVHKAYSEDSELGREMMGRLQKVNAQYGSSVSMYGAVAGGFENLIELGAAYSHSPEQLKSYSQEMYDIADEWAKRVRKLTGNWNPLQARDKNGRWTKVPNPGKVTVLKQLGGSTGAKLVQDEQGRKWVMKTGPSKDALVNESMADEAYRRLGMTVPEGGLHVGPNGEVTKFTKFIEGGKTLGEWEKGKTPEQIAEVHDEIRRGFLADAMMGNWDVVGMSKDNIMVGPDGKVYRVDNGGALAYRAQGAKKPEAQFTDKVQELGTMLDHSKNPSTAAMFAGLTPTQMLEQVAALDSVDHKKFLAAFDSDPALKAKMEARLADLGKQVAAMPGNAVPAGGKFALPDDPMKQVGQKPVGMFAGVQAKDIPGWAHLHGKGEQEVSYGAVLYRKNPDTGETEVLLRKPTGNFDGYHWTFPKGSHDQADPLATAKKEVLEEMGHEFNPTGHIQETFKSPGGKENAYFIGQVTGGHDITKMDGETEAMKWTPVAHAVTLIGRGTNAEGVTRDLKVLEAFAKQQGVSLTPSSSTPKPAAPLPVGAKVVDPLHTAGGLHAHLKNKGITDLALKKLAYMNPNGIQGGVVYSPKSSKDQLAKLLPPGTVIKSKSISEADIKDYKVPDAPKVGATAVPAGPTSPPTIKIPDSVTAPVKAKQAAAAAAKAAPPGVKVVGFNQTFTKGSAEHTLQTMFSKIHSTMSEAEVKAEVASVVQSLDPADKGKLKAFLGIAPGQQGTNEAAYQSLIASAGFKPTASGGTAQQYSPPPPPTPTATGKKKAAGTAGSGTKPSTGKQAGGTFVQPKKTMSIDGVHVVTHADEGAKASAHPINAVPISVFAGHAFHQVDEGSLPDFSAKLPPISSNSKVKLPTNKEYVDNAVQAKWHASLTKAESSAVASWKGNSTGVRQAIYDAVKSGKPLSGNGLEIIKAIQKAPPQPGVYYRGLHGSFATNLVAEAKKALASGNEAWMYDVAPHGMSTNPGMASAFSYNHTVLRIVSKSARSLRGIHNYDGEDEILGVPGARYRVKAIHEQVHFDGDTHKYVIDMEEI